MLALSSGPASASADVWKGTEQKRVTQHVENKRNVYDPRNVETSAAVCFSTADSGAALLFMALR